MDVLLLATSVASMVVNGTTIILTSLVAVFAFGEKLTKRQLVGLAGGLLSLAAICII